MKRGVAMDDTKRVQSVINIIKDYHERDVRFIPKICVLNRDETIPTFWGMFLYPDECKMISVATSSVSLLDEYDCKFINRDGTLLIKAEEWVDKRGCWENNNERTRQIIAYKAGNKGE